MKRQFLLIIIVAISASAVCQSTLTSQTIDNAIQELTHNVGSNGSTHAITSFVSFSSKEDTKGSRYLFTKWVKGDVTNSNDILINNDSFFFNFDKISNSLYLTRDKKQVVELDKEQIKSFNLKTDGGDLMKFERVSAINPALFFQVLEGTQGKYTVYKLTHTKFEKSNFRSDGLVETGKNYDEYVDLNEYYILLPNGTEARKIELSKKSIKKMMASEPKVDAYISKHKYDDINEDFLKDMVNSINQ